MLPVECVTLLERCMAALLRARLPDGRGFVAPHQKWERAPSHVTTAYVAWALGEAEPSRMAEELRPELEVAWRHAQVALSKCPRLEVFPPSA